jgi:hypothetical protein
MEHVLSDGSLLSTTGLMTNYANWEDWKEMLESDSLSLDVKLVLLGRLTSKGMLSSQIVQDLEALKNFLGCIVRILNPLVVMLSPTRNIAVRRVMSPYVLVRDDQHRDVEQTFYKWKARYVAVQVLWMYALIISGHSCVTHEGSNEPFNYSLFRESGEVRLFGSMEELEREKQEELMQKLKDFVMVEFHGLPIRPLLGLMDGCLTPRDVFWTTLMDVPPLHSCFDSSIDIP